MSLVAPDHPLREGRSRLRSYGGMRILLVSQMYPGPDDPDLGVFVEQMEEALATVVTSSSVRSCDGRGGGKRRYAELGTDARTRRRPVSSPTSIYAHFLVPGGRRPIAALAGDVPLVSPRTDETCATSAGDPGSRSATRLVIRRAVRVVCVSGLPPTRGADPRRRFPGSNRKVSTSSSCGVDVEPLPRRRRAGEARTRLGWHGAGRVRLFVGAHRARGRTPVASRERVRACGRRPARFVGDGPLRPQPRGPTEASVIVGRIPHVEVAALDRRRRRRLPAER